MSAVIYLDYAATTPVDPRVAQIMCECLQSPQLFANPSSAHEPGRQARQAVEAARARVAHLVNADPAEIICTSGATEANNLAILGVARFRRSRGRHVVTSVMEHASVRECFAVLETEGFRVSYVQPDSEGVVTADAVAAALQPDTILASVMHVNNETGAVQDIAAIGRICRERGVLYHSDAAQSAGREALDVKVQSVDLLSMSAHKMYGPKGAGALYLNAERVPRLEPLLRGGGQERGLRPGTLATHQLAGFGVAAELAEHRREQDWRRSRALCDLLWRRIGGLPGVLLNSPAQKSCCHILNVSVPGVEGESLLLALAGLAVSSGSACASDHDEPSQVLRALGRPDQVAQSSIRFSVGRGTSETDIEQAAEIFVRAVGRLRALSPARHAATV